MWGTEPWENDRAADWYARLIGESGFAQTVRQTLQRVLEADYIDDEQYLVRAACYSLIHFGQVYIWPVESLTDDLGLGIAAIQRVLTETDDEQMEGLLKEDLRQLNSRLSELNRS